MACALSWFSEDCALGHWRPAVGGEPEPRGKRERAPCPICHAPRALSYWPAGQHVAWRDYCREHDRGTIFPVLVKLIAEGCVYRSGGRPPRLDSDELMRITLAVMPPLSRQLALLELQGFSTREALDKLGVARQNRPRVIAGRTQS